MTRAVACSEVSTSSAIYEVGERMSSSHYDFVVATIVWVLCVEGVPASGKLPRSSAKASRSFGLANQRLRLVEAAHHQAHDHYLRSSPEN